MLLRPTGFLPSLSRAFDSPLGAGGSLRSAGVWYRALRRLLGRVSHPLEQRVFQDAMIVSVAEWVWLNADLTNFNRRLGARNRPVGS